MQEVKITYNRRNRAQKKIEISKINETMNLAKKDEKPNQNVQDTVLEEETENIKEESIDELNPEDEILELENLEKSQEKISENKIDTVQETVPQDDIWNIGKISRRKSSDSSQTLRFAEDIEDLKGGITARKDRRGSSQNTNTRSKKAKPTKKRR